MSKTRKKRKNKNPLAHDPSRTTTLRRRFMAEMYKRFRALKAEINKLVVDHDAFGISADAKQAAVAATGGGLTAALGPVMNTRWRFQSDSDKIDSYHAWLQEKVDSGILGVSAANQKSPWMEPYVTASYQKGVARSFTDTNKARKAAARVAGASMDFYEGGKAEFLNTAFNSDTATAKIKQLHTRAFSQLKGVTATMDQQMSRVLSDGLTAGKGAREVAADLNGIVDNMEKRRARVIARTELIHCHAEGQLDSLEMLGVEELGLMVEWNTTLDDKVSDLCRPMHGVVFTIKEARGMIPRHPNCRCAWIPAGVGEHTHGTTTGQWIGDEQQGLQPPGTKATGKGYGQVWSQDERTARMRESLKAEKPGLTAKEARAKSTWVGADIIKPAYKPKPGSKAWQKAQAAARRSNAASLAQRTQAAKKAKAEAAALHSLKTKAGLVKSKYKLTDDMLFYPNGQTIPALSKDGFKIYTKAKLGTAATDADWDALLVKARALLDEQPAAPYLKTQMQAAEAFVEKATAAKAAKEAAAKAAKDFKFNVATTKAKKGVMGKIDGSGMDAVLKKELIEGYVNDQGVYLSPLQFKAVKNAKPAAVLYDSELAKIWADPKTAPKWVWQLDTIEKIKDTKPPAFATAKAAADFDTATQSGLGKWAGAGVREKDLPNYNEDAFKALKDWDEPAEKQSYGVILFNDKGEVLLRKPTGNYGGARWTFAKGGGEKPLKTALDELAEETGHKGAIYDAVPGSFKGKETKTNYFMGKSTKLDPALMDKETAATKWMSYEEALEAVQSNDPAVAKRDVAVLKAAFKQLHNPAGPKAFDAIKAAAGDTVAKAAASKKIKLGMAKKHYAKPKFGGGLVEASDWDVYTPDKMSYTGLDKVLSEKGWSMATLPDKNTAAALALADDVVDQKAIIDKLKKAPKTAPAPTPRPRPATAPATTAATAENAPLPALGDLTKIKDLPGSTRPYLAEDPTGRRWVVKDTTKTAIKPAHLRSEAEADEIYRRLGLATNNGGVLDTPNGPVKVTEFFEGGETLADWAEWHTEAEIKEMHAQIKGGFVADALLANHDVAGLDFDNIFITNGIARRIDNGGALTFRAQGGAKTTWGDEVLEIKSMLDRGMNRQTATIFAGITEEEIHTQIRHIVKNKQAVLGAVAAPETRRVLANRIDYLEGLLPARKAATTPAGRGTVTAASVEPAAVQKATSNGINIAGDADMIEDNNMLVWGESTMTKRPLTKLQFKVSDAGSNRISAALGPELQKSAPAAVAQPHHADNYWASILAGAKTIGAHAGDKKYNMATLENLDKTEVAIKKTKALASGDMLDMLNHYEETIKTLKAHKAAGTAPVKDVDAVQYLVKPKTSPRDATATARRRDYRVSPEDGIKFRVNEFENGRARNTSGYNRFEAGQVYNIEAGEGVRIQFIPRTGSWQRQMGQAMEGTVSITVQGEVSEQTIKKALEVVEDLGINTAHDAAYEEALYIHRGVYLRRKHTLKTYTEIWESDMAPAEKVEKMKAWVKANMGIDLTKANYNPAGKSKHADGGGFRHWERWDFGSREQAKKDLGDMFVYHHPYSGIEAIVRGVAGSGGEFTTTTGRIRKGVNIGQNGMSSSADVETGGASYFFTRVRDKAHGVGLFFKPRTLLRQDAISYDGDYYGRISNIPNRAKTLEELKNMTNYGSNETLFKEGLSMDDIEFFKCANESERKRVITALKETGYATMPDGRKAEDVVVTVQPKNRFFD